ncbi:MAG: hypothetical protein U9R54_05800, partial [Bacteroidota bacterium]|nr:hypothetical protein [Bacteroidota bacterium]
NSADMSLLVCRANRVWNKADDKMLKLYQNSINHKPLVILNGVKLEFLESIIGEVPKKRGFIRRLGKRIITLQIYSKKKV